MEESKQYKKSIEEDLMKCIKMQSPVSFLTYRTSKFFSPKLVE